MLFRSSKVLYIEQDDFMENPPKQFFRLAPGREVRLRWGYLITCQEAVKDPVTGEVVELRCTYDPETRGGNAPDGRKVKSTIHWVSAEHALEAEVRLYDRLFTKEDMNDLAEGEDWRQYLNPQSLTVSKVYVEPSLADAKGGGVPYQFPADATTSTPAASSSRSNASDTASKPSSPSLSTIASMSAAKRSTRALSVMSVPFCPCRHRKVLLRCRVESPSARCARSA